MKKVDFLARLETKQPRLFSFYNYDNLPEEFNIQDKIPIQCPDHGIFEQKAYSHGNGQGCLECYRLSRSTGLNNFIAKAKKVHGDRYRYEKVKYLNSYTKVTITCKTHGDFEQTPDSHLKGHNCSQCTSIKLDLETFVKKANEVHNSYYDYSQTVYHNSKEKVTIGCPKHGSFEQVAMSHLKGIGCKKCGTEKKTSTLEYFRNRAKEAHGELYDYSETEYINSTTKVKIKCSTHGIFEQLPLHHLQGSGCFRCKESKGEIAIANLLTSYGVGYVREHVIGNSRFRYDFFLPDQNILIEFHGIQHYKAIDYWGGEKGFIKQQQRDGEKTRIAKENAIPLIVLNYQHLDSGYLESNLLSQLTKLYKYWISTPNGILTFKGSREVCEFLGMKHSPLPTLIFKVLSEKHPSYKVLF